MGHRRSVGLPVTATREEIRAALEAAGARARAAAEAEPPLTPPPEADAAAMERVNARAAQNARRDQAKRYETLRGAWAAAFAVAQALPPGETKRLAQVASDALREAVRALDADIERGP